MQTTTWMLALGPVLEGGRPGAEAWLAVGLVSLSTLAGAWLARRASERLTMWLTVASAMMMVTALTDLLPDAWQDAVEHGVPLWVVGVSVAVGFLVITYFTRKGCGHGHRRPKTLARHAPGLHRRVKQAVGAALFGGMGTAAALTVHRTIEGATLALAASAVVVIALMVHSASEGLALAALLDMARQRLWPWLVVSCVSPAVGVLVAGAGPIPGQVVPLLLGAVTGVLLRTAIVGIRLASGNGSGLPRRHLVLAGVAAATMTAGLAALHWVSPPLVSDDTKHDGLRPKTNQRVQPTDGPNARVRPTPTSSPAKRLRKHPREGAKLDG
ncbi:hypothetical protein OHA25_57325 [Nonomuraea sp. NBC_00507]|uniref:hypothetical protein n=1 Tax=Nonomuraea sp. NBC_00507 TaxID=2976002 RepID=UPI002E16D756